MALTPLVGAALLVVALAGCASPPTTVPTPALPPPAVPAPAAPVSYQDRLTQVDQELAGALAEVGRAGDPDVLERSVLAAAAVASAAGERMQNAPVDPAVARANAALGNGLRQLGRELAFLSQQVHQREICAGPAAVGAISTAPSMPALRAVAAGLGLPGDDGLTYRWGSSLPVEPPAGEVAENRLPNGTVLVDRRVARVGDGVLEIRNEGGDDAVVVLSRDGSALVSVAVTAGQSTEVAGIGDGDYALDFTTGRDWDAGLAVFSRGCRFRRFTAPTSFVTRPVPGGSAVTVASIALRGEPDDTATTDLLPGELPR